MMKHLVLFVMIASILFGSDKLNFENNKIYVVDFFASWCSSCEKEIPVLSKMNENFKTRSIELVGVNIDKNLAEGEKFRKRLAKYFNFKVVNDESNSIVNSYKPLGMPAIYIIKDKKICGQIFGATANLEQNIEDKIKKCEEQK